VLDQRAVTKFLRDLGMEFEMQEQCLTQTRGCVCGNFELGQFRSGGELRCFEAP